MIGPSKSGKTVLVEKVVGTKNLITIPGGDIQSADDLWHAILKKLNIPLSTTRTTASSTEAGMETKVSTKAGIPFVAEGTVEATPSFSRTSGRGSENTALPAGKEEAINALAEAKKTLLIDDFHYIPEKAQTVISQQIKDIIRRNIRTIVLLVPHRAEDPLRANPDLRGRILEIEFRYWDVSSLIEIGNAGFPLLDIPVDEATMKKLAEESLTSPQLMQLLCLEAAGVFSGTTDREVPKVCELASASTNASTIIGVLRNGPASHGKERMQYSLKSGGEGDNYSLLLQALRGNPPKLSLSLDELRNRIQDAIHSSDGPQRNQVTTSLNKWNEILLKSDPPDRVLEWRESPPTLTIIDPYFLFHLRWRD